MPLKFLIVESDDLFDKKLTRIRGELTNQQIASLELKAKPSLYDTPSDETNITAENGYYVAEQPAHRVLERIAQLGYKVIGG